MLHSATAALASLFSSKQKQGRDLPFVHMGTAPVYYPH